MNAITLICSAIFFRDSFFGQLSHAEYQRGKSSASSADLNKFQEYIVQFICKNFLEIFQAESVWVPGVSLLDGIAYDYGEKKKFIKSVHNFENDILVASKNIAKRYSTGKDHIKGTTDIALTIFDSMKKVHGMAQENGCFCRLRYSFMTVENTSVWQMLLNVRIGSLWQPRSLDFQRKNAKSLPVR